MHGITPFLTLQFSSVQEGIYMLVKAPSVLLPITQMLSMLAALETVLILTEYGTPFFLVPVEVRRLHTFPPFSALHISPLFNYSTNFSSL